MDREWAMDREERVRMRARYERRRRTTTRQYASRKDKKREERGEKRQKTEKWV
jgi:hypothetical protein